MGRTLRFALAALLTMPVLWSLMVPGVALAKGPIPEEPFQKVILKNGTWSTEYIEWDGKTNLAVGYRGGCSIDDTVLSDSQTGQPMATLPSVQFRISSDILLKGVYIPTIHAQGAQPPPLRVAFKDAKGNTYGPFDSIVVDPIVDRTALLAALQGEQPPAPTCRDDVFVPQPSEEIFLPAGAYSLEVSSPASVIRNGDTGASGAILIKGIEYSAWQRYQDELELWETSVAQEAAVKTEDGQARAAILGDEALAKTLAMPQARSQPSTGASAAGAAVPAEEARISLKNSFTLKQIALNTADSGKGVTPGTISIVDASGKVFGTYQTSGAALAGRPNAVWVASPNIVLPAGDYRLVPSDPSAIARDAQGSPNFYAAVAPAIPKRFNFTGRYIIDLDVVKRLTLRGPANETALSLKEWELSVLDRGDTIELIGKYEGMPFSQLCRVTERDENKVTAALQFAMDLSNLPYKAKIGATATVVLEKPPGLQPRITINGIGTYKREYTKERGVDDNTYAVAGKGLMFGRELPAFVAAMLGAKTGSAGNVPGPDSPLHGAVGMLFPPLAGLAVHLAQEAFRRRPKREVPERRGVKGIIGADLSPGEKAMSEANRSMTKDDRETRAMVMLAEALANSDEPDDDAVSIGDNERPGGADYVPSESPADSSGEGAYEADGQYEADEQYEEEYAGASDASYGDDAGAYSEASVLGSEREQVEAERDEWMKNLEDSMRSADPSDPRAAELHQQYRDYIEYLDSRSAELASTASAYDQQTVTVTVDHTGRTADVAYNPDTGEWFNTESGNTFDFERYNRDVAPNFANDRAFIDEQRNKLETRDTAFDHAMDAMVEDQQMRANLLGQLQNLRNQAYGIEPPAKGVGDVKANIDQLITDLSSKDLSSRDLQDRARGIAKVVTGRMTGRTISEDQARSIHDSTNMSIAADTVLEGWKDVITGRTWAGMGGRILLGGLTGGASEYVMSPAEALFDIKESIDSGESGGRATLKAMGKYALGELAGAYLGLGWEASGLRLKPEFVTGATKLGNTPVSKLPALIGEALGYGAKAGKAAVGETADLAVRTASKETLESMARSNNATGAADGADYARYKAGVKEQANVIQGKIDSGEPVNIDDMRKVLRDPSISRELKNVDPHVQNSYQDALEEKLYNPAKANTAAELERNLRDSVQKEFGPGARVKVEIDSIRTPQAKGAPPPPRINADHDLTGKITITRHDGTTVTRELKANSVAPVYNEKFADAAGMMKNGEFDVAKAKAEMPEGITITGPDGKPRNIGWEQATREQQLDAFAKRHGQEVTDVHSAEAAVDFNAAKGTGGVSNVAALKAGDPTAKLTDPGGLAKMEQYKINNYFNKGGIENQTEAFEQLGKMGKLTNDLTDAYQKLGYRPSAMPADMQEALNIVSNRNLSPGQRTIELQRLHFDGPGDLANKLSARVEGLQKLGGLSTGSAAGGTSANRALEKVMSTIVRSHLKSE